MPCILVAAHWCPQFIYSIITQRFNCERKYWNIIFFILPFRRLFIPFRGSLVHLISFPNTELGCGGLQKRRWGGRNHNVGSHCDVCQLSAMDDGIVYRPNPTTNSLEPITMTSILTGHKRVVYVQALSRPPVDICLLILHDNELVIFSAVKHPGKSILYFTVIKGLMRYERSSKRIMMSIAHTQIRQCICYCLPYTVLCGFVNLQLVTLPLWQHHGGGGDGTGVGVSGVECAATAISLAGDQR